mgnify:CR=1 FL=1
MDNQKVGLTGLELLLVVFVVLKLIGVIAWPWWWVLSPVWIPAGLVLLVLLGKWIAFRILMR